MNKTASEIKRSDILIRGLYMILFFIAGRISLFLIYFLACVGFIIHLIMKELNQNIVSYSKLLGIYLNQVSDYLTYNTELKPWPFSPWPKLKKAKKA